MSLKVLESKWKTALTSILEQLTESQFTKLLFNLDKIPQGVKSGKVREEIPLIIIQYFGTEGSISVIDKEMKQLPRMDAAVQGLLRPFVDKLKKQRQKNKETGGKAAADSGSVAKRKKPAAEAARKVAADSGSVAKRQKPAADQEKSCKPDKIDSAAGSVQPKQKKTEKSLKSTGTTKVPKVDPVKPVKPKQKKTEKPLASTGAPKVSKVQSAAAQPGKMKTAGTKKASKKSAALEAIFSCQ